MIDKLKKAEDRFEKIEEALADPEIFSKQTEYTALMKERKNLSPVIEKFREYKEAESARDGAKELRDDSSVESELREMAAEEYNTENEHCEKLLDELKSCFSRKTPTMTKTLSLKSVRARAAKRRHFLPQFSTACTQCMRQMRALNASL